MSVHDLSGDDTAVARMEEVARSALGRYGWGPESSVSLLNVSENATFLVEADGSGPTVLRVHRLGYHDRAAIESELAWMDALRNEAGIRTPRILPAADGSRVVTVEDAALGERRHCVLFEYLAGEEPPEDDVARFQQLGALTARMHRHARSWRRPAGFTRFRWDCSAAFGPEARWGRWQDGYGVGPSELQVLGRLETTLRRRLEAYGTGPERFGLVHADTRMANLLVERDEVSVIDFDDCGFGWYLYDLATSFSFFEHRPRVEELTEAWLAGYRELLPLEAADTAEIRTLILFRRLLLVAWLGSHSAAELSSQLGAGYTEGTCLLAERYLEDYG